MVCDDIDSVAVAKIGIEPVPYTDLNPSCETEVMIPRQTAYNLPPRLSWSRPHTAIAPMLEENIAKTPVLVHPKVVAIFAVLLFWRFGRPCGPLAAAVKQIAEEKDGVGVKKGLEARVCTAEVEVGVFVSERIERPRAARVGMGINELGVSDKEESMWVRASFLQLRLDADLSIILEEELAYPILPPVPIAALYRAIKNAPLSPIQHHPPQQHQRIRQREQPSKAPLPSSKRTVPPIHCRSYPVEEEGPRYSPCLRGQALGLSVCANGDTIVVVRSHRRSKGMRCCWRSIVEGERKSESWMRR